MLYVVIAIIYFSQSGLQIFLVMTTKTPRGRPRAFDKDEAVSTARRLFHERGFDGVGVAELGEAMGVKPPSLYAAFGSKRNLYQLALKDYVNDEGGWIPSVLSSHSRVAEAIAAVFDEAAKRYTQTPTGLGCMVIEGVNHCSDEQASSTVRAMCAATRDAICDRIAREHPDHAAVLADYVTVMLHGLSAAARSGMSQQALQEVAKIAAEGFTHAAR